MLLKTKAELDAALDEANAEASEALRAIAERYAGKGIRAFMMLVGISEDNVGQFSTRSNGNLSQRVLHEIFVAELEHAGAAIAIGITPENADALREIKEDLEKKVGEQQASWPAS